VSVIKLRRGTSIPTTSNTQPYELGYNKSSNQMYIHDGTSIVRMAGKAWRRVTNRQTKYSSMPSSYLEDAKSIMIVFEKDFGIDFKIGQIIIPNKIIIGNSSNTEIDNPNDYKYGDGYHSLIWANPDSMEIEQAIISIGITGSNFYVSSYTSGVLITIYIDTNY
jgi:hypothetical protein